MLASPFNAVRSHGLIGPERRWQDHVFNVITGLYTPDKRHFELAGSSPTSRPAVHEGRAKAGIAVRTFQNIASVCRNDRRLRT